MKLGNGFRAHDEPLGFSVLVLIVFGAGVPAAACESALACARAPWVRARTGLFFAALVDTLLFTLVLSFALAALVWLTRRALPPFASTGFGSRGEPHQPARWLEAALPALGFFVFLDARAVGWLFAHAKNRELAALIAALTSLVLGFVSTIFGILWFAFLRELATRKRTRTRWLLSLLSWLLLLACALLALRTSGLEQLDEGLALGPALWLLGLYPAARLTRRAAINQARRVLAAVAGALLLCCISASILAEDTLPTLARAGAWSPPTLRVLRALSDFDGDGYSGWFGGGDCAPFDPKVHPGAIEIPFDGIDNDCVGGDGRERYGLMAPKPSHEALPSVLAHANLLLITVETLRADHVSFLGYARPTTPRLDELAKSSVVFARTYASAPTTRLSLAALFSGRLPSKIHWLPQDPSKQMRRIAEDNPWLPSTLANDGYATIAVQAAFRAFTDVENAGFDRGFQHYDVSTPLAYVGGTMHGFPGAMQVERALTWLDDVAQRPFFLWLHLLEPHYVYERSPRAPNFGDDERALYDSEIAEADLQIGRLLDALRARNLFENTVIFVSGDHGEEFGEHGQRWHGSNLYEPQVRTAALLRVPGLAARRIELPVTFVDFTPTLLDLLSVHNGFESLMGRNLTANITRGISVKSGLFIENFQVDNGANALTALVDGPFKLIRGGGGSELYDEAHDPNERHNLYSTDNPVARSLDERMSAYLASGVPARAAPPSH